MIQQDRALKFKLAGSIGLRTTNKRQVHKVPAQHVTYSIELLAVPDHVGTTSVCLWRAKASAISLLWSEITFSSQAVQYVKTGNAGHLFYNMNLSTQKLRSRLGKLLNEIWLLQARLYPIICIIILAGLAWLWPTVKPSSFCRRPSGRRSMQDKIFF